MRTNRAKVEAERKEAIWKRIQTIHRLATEVRMMMHRIQNLETIRTVLDGRTEGIQTLAKQTMIALEK